MNSKSPDLKNIPEKTGVYKMYNKSGVLLYVGKAKNLKKRVQSYFNKNVGGKTELLVSEIAEIKFELTNNEHEALLRECELIKEHHPKFNILLRDDKSYPYLALSKGNFPYISIFRGEKNSNNEKYFGPYTTPRIARETLYYLQKIFQIRQCNDSFFKSRKRPCLQYQIKRCTAPCVGKVSKEDYAHDIKFAVDFLRGKNKELIHMLSQQMQKFSDEKKYELAANYRDKIKYLRKAQQMHVGEVESFEDLIISKTESARYYNQFLQLKNLLNLTDVPNRIECFDISHTQGHDTVGSCVVFNIDGPHKDHYRKFAVKDITPGDDYAALRQVISRRLKIKDLPMPDLLLIDGGKGQLEQALEVLNQLNLSEKITALSIAKGEGRKPQFDKLFWGINKEELLLPNNSKLFHLLQRVRDEAHRFAIGYHRSKLAKSSIKSVLEEIEGVGKKRRQDLLNSLGGFTEIKNATIEELKSVPGISHAIAERIYKKFHD